jgi:preprotein translocase subunit SecF
MHISKNLSYLFVIAGALVLVSAAAIAVWGLKPGIDLEGGSLVQISYAGQVPAVSQIEAAGAPLNLGEVRVQPAGESAYIIRTRALTNDEKNAFEHALGTLGAMHEDQYSEIGPTIGAELVSKAWIAVALVLACIVAFIAFAFRTVSKPVSSWKYGLVTILTLLFDILVPVGLFAILGHIVGAEVDSLFIVALLTITGISINDKIVVFDRVRENLLRAHGRAVDFGSVVDASVRQTLARSINTSLTVVIVLVSLYLWGPSTTKVFALTLTAGMIVGTYSSIFLASPLLVAWERWQKKA